MRRWLFGQAAYHGGFYGKGYVLIFSDTVNDVGTRLFSTGTPEQQAKRAKVHCYCYCNTADQGFGFDACLSDQAMYGALMIELTGGMDSYEQERFDLDYKSANVRLGC